MNKKKKQKHNSTNTNNKVCRIIKLRFLHSIDLSTYKFSSQTNNSLILAGAGNVKFPLLNSLKKSFPMA